ncbi:hypothetical protein AAEZ42_05315 [Limosilactobacillus fermentum]
MVGQIMPTPRSWERASRNLTSLRKLPAAQSRAVLADVLAGDLGEEVGVDLAQVILTPAVGIEELLSAPSPVTEMVAPCRKVIASTWSTSGWGKRCHWT